MRFINSAKLEYRKAIKNGYGRYELNKIHPELKHKHQHGLSIHALLRLCFGAYGYIKAILGGKGSDK